MTIEIVITHKNHFYFDSELPWRYRRSNPARDSLRREWGSSKKDISQRVLGQRQERLSSSRCRLSVHRHSQPSVQVGCHRYPGGAPSQTSLHGTEGVHYRPQMLLVQKL